MVSWVVRHNIVRYQFFVNKSIGSMPYQDNSSRILNFICVEIGKLMLNLYGPRYAKDQE